MNFSHNSLRLLTYRRCGCLATTVDKRLVQLLLLRLVYWFRASGLPDAVIETVVGRFVYLYRFLG